MKQPLFAIYPWFLFAIPTPTVSLNVLIISPSLAKSIALFHDQLACALHIQGHNVTVLHQLFTGNHAVIQPPCAIPTINHMPPDHGHLRKLHTELYQSWVYSPEQGLLKAVNFLSFYDRLHIAACRAFGQDSSLLNQLKEQQYDIAIAYVFCYCPIALAAKLGIPAIWLSTGNYVEDFMADYQSLPAPASYVPDLFLSYSDNMGFLQRLTNELWLLQLLIRDRLPYASHEQQRSAFHGAEPSTLPSFSDLSETVLQSFVNGDRLVDLPRPIIASFHYLSSFTNNKAVKSTQQPAVESILRKDLQDCIDGAAKGVVLFSFGTQANTDEMPAYMKDAFVGAFKQFPDYNIIWKVTSIFTLPDDAKNIKLMTWIAQKQLLHHPKMKLFITHGGYNSLLEACDAGVPILSIPLFLDQFGNSQRSNRLGFGLTLDKSNLTVRTVSQTMHELLQNDKYRQRARKVSAMLSDVPISNREHFVFLVERSYRHHKVINRLTKIRRINFIKFYYIDLVAGILSMCLLVAKLCVSCIVKYLRMNKAT